MAGSILIEGISKEELIQLITGIVDSKFEQYIKKSQPENLSVDEVAQILGVSRLTVYNYIKNGNFPAFKVGRKFVIKRSDVEEALELHKSLKYKRLK